MTAEQSGVENDQQGRKDLIAFFGEFFDVAPTAVPAPKDDHLYDPTVLAVRDKNGVLIGGLLACRPQIVVLDSIRPRAMPSFGHSDSGSSVMNLDLLAVSPQHRRQRVARRLVDQAERLLREKGARILYGNVSSSEEAEVAAKFYRSAGYKVLEPGSALPTFRGKKWTAPMEPDPFLWFWKPL